jgi:hypothetical protein
MLHSLLGLLVTLGRHLLDRRSVLEAFERRTRTCRNRIKCLPV